MYLKKDASKARLREAENARKNRQEIVKALSHGQVTRRDLIKMGLFTTAGLLAPIGGLNPFVGSARANGGTSIPTGLAPSPLFGVQAFSAPLPRFDLVPRNPISVLNPAPMAYANQTQQLLDPALVGGRTGLTGPIEGRPPGSIWAHQQFAKFPPQIAVQMTQQANRDNGSASKNPDGTSGYNPGVSTSAMNNGIDPTQTIPCAFHPKFPTQVGNHVWTFNGTIPPKLVQGRYMQPLLFRHTNKLPADVTQNEGFGRNTISTHEHNGHHGAENDGFTGAYFYPNQFYDYHWPIVLAGITSMNTAAQDPMACTPNERGGTDKIPGDWHETMSTHWFHDHMFSFTSQNVYKGNAAMFNIYSGIDRGAEDVSDGVNLCLPSGYAASAPNSQTWGCVDYDVNLMLADKAFDSNGQLMMDIFNFDGFLGDVMTVNLTYRPYFKVEPRRYRFRILNASVSRFFKTGLCDESGNAVPFWQIGNDGNLLPHPVLLTQTDEQGIAERYDLVVDFSNFKGKNLYFVNLCEHQDGKKPAADLSLSDALSGKSSDPCVGKFLQFQVGTTVTYPDKSLDFFGKDAGSTQVGQLSQKITLIPNPDLSQIPISRYRTFVFGSGGSQPQNDPVSSFIGPWGVATDGGSMLNADFGRVSAAPGYGTREVWTIQNGGGGWDHPIHIHFEEGQILARNGSASNVPTWETGRKDVYRLRPAGSVTLTMQFRDWGGMFMEHCHNTMHEDNAMLIRWEIDNSGTPFMRPLPTPIPSPTGVTFESPDDIAPTAF